MLNGGQVLASNLSGKVVVTDPLPNSTLKQWELLFPGSAGSSEPGFGSAFQLKDRATQKCVQDIGSKPSTDRGHMRDQPRSELAYSQAPGAVGDLARRVDRVRRRDNGEGDEEFSHDVVPPAGTRRTNRPELHQPTTIAYSRSSRVLPS